MYIHYKIPMFRMKRLRGVNHHKRSYSENIIKKFEKKKKMLKMRKISPFK
jgi:hypothetical protein